MHPYIDIFGFKFAVYDIFALVGLIVQHFVFVYAVRKRGGLVSCAREVQLIGLFFGAVGMKLLYALTRYDLWGVASPDVIFGGGVFYGGLFGTLLAGLAVLKIKGVDATPYTDAAALAIPLFHSFGRVGCFFSGCCYGVSSRHGFILDGIKRFPVQLLSAFLLLVLFLVLFIMFEKNLFSGKLLYIYLGIYAVGRFFTEFLRGDEVRGKIWVLSTSQLISILLLLTVFLLYIKRTKENKW